METIDTTFVSSVGEFVNDFEIKLAEYTGVKHAIASVYGTAALHVALKLSGIPLNILDFSCFIFTTFPWEISLELTTLPPKAIAIAW